MTSDLLEVAVTAHGGMDRWNRVTSINVAASITGATWFVKGKGDVHYATDYREVDGIIFPTTRRIYGWEGDYQLIPEPLLIAIEMSEITTH